MKGFSARNLRCMRQFAENYTDEEKKVNTSKRNLILNGNIKAKLKDWKKKIID